MKTFPEAIIGCPLSTTYGYVKNRSFITRRAMMGRPRHQLKDPSSVLFFDLFFDANLSQFNAWQTFWQAISNGQEWFLMDLTADTPARVTYECHATGPFTASYLQPNRYTFSLNVEGVLHA